MLPPMTDETPDLPLSAEDSPDGEPVAKKNPRKKVVGKKAARSAEEVEVPAGDADAGARNAEAGPEAVSADAGKADPADEGKAATAGEGKASPTSEGASPQEAAPPGAAPDKAVTKVTVDEESGIETREIESANARRVSSKPLRANREASENDPAAEHETPRPERAERAEAGSPGSEEGSIPFITEPPGAEDSGPGGKRRRRRRRKGGGEEPEVAEAAPRQPQRSAIDPKTLASKAWKIYKAEVAEEGLALINDQDARDLSRRSFRLAEIFLEEASRRQ